MPRFYEDTCEHDGCEREVVAIVADQVKVWTDGQWKTRTDEVHGFCSKHERHSQTRKDWSTSPDEELPF